ncbi:MAG: ABC transporter substrate-binding protein [Deltaproteobacteria bacterium]|nr:ABC transporter substrate-binding protein [Deltaproteobacteria bacterium]
MTVSVKVFFAMVLLSKLGATNADAQPTLKMGYSGAGVAQSLNNTIEKAGLWQKHNVDVKAIYFNSGALTAQAFVGGDIDLTDSDTPAMLNLKAAGVLDVRIIAGWMNRITLGFIARKPIKSPAELKGKRIAISRFGSSSDFITRMLLRYWKLNPEKDVAIIQSGGNDAIRIAALTAGHIDGALIGAYYLAQILETGCCINLADLEDLPIEYARFGTIVPVAALRAKRDIFRKYLEALTEGIHVFKTRPELPISILKGQGLKDAEASYKRIAKVLVEFPVPDEKAVQTTLDFIGTPKAKQALAKDYIDNTLLQDIKRSGFIERLYGR